MVQRDAEAINRSVDLLALIGADTPLKRVAGSGGGEWHGPCPFCGGTDRFVVQPRAAWPHWWCRQCSDKPDDAIGYVRRRDGLSFVAACDQLSGVTAPPERKRKELTMTTDTAKETTAPPLTWQGVAVDFVEAAEEALWDAGGSSAREYLAKRGLSDATMREAHLGYFARDSRRNGATCPAGITIPWFYDGECWQLKVRRRSGSEPKYLNLSGGHPYLFTTPAGLPDAGPLVLTEGEFDALLLAQELRGLAAVASLGSSSTGAAGLPAGVERVLRRYSPLFLAYDNDAAGLAGAAALGKLLPRAKRLPIPDGKDITEFWQRGGRLRDWVEAHLARLTLLDSVVEEPPPKPDWQCDMPHCVARTFAERDPETGGFCTAHSDRWHLLNLASLVDWPEVRVGDELIAGRSEYRAFAQSAADADIAAAYAAVDARVPALVEA